MTPSIVEKKKYTYEDYLKISEDKRYELIHGELLMTPSPVPNHQRILKKIGFLLERFVSENKSGEIFIAPCDVYLDDENVVQPDILFISQNRLDIIGEKNIQGAPDVVVEIVSENSAYRDMVQKKSIYAKFGIQEYWLVIPEAEEIEIYIIKDKSYQSYKKYSKDDILESNLLKGLKIRLREIFIQ